MAQKQQTRDLSNNGTHGFECECGFASEGWSSKSARDDRKRAHLKEHETGKPMPELADVR